MATVLNPGMVDRLDKAITAKNPGSPFRSNSEVALQVATTTTSNVYLLPRDQTRPDDCVRMINTGTSIVRFRFGGPTSVATLADKGVVPGATEVFRMSPGTTHISLISAAAGSVEINCGEGI